MTEQIGRILAETTRLAERLERRRDRKRRLDLREILAILQQLYNPTTGGVPGAALPDLAGDVTGRPNANTVVKIQNQAVSTTDPTTGQTLVWDGAAYVPTTPASTGHTIEDEGTPLTQRATLNFTGAGVTVTDSGGKTVATIPAWAPTDAHYLTTQAESGLSAEVLLSAVIGYGLLSARTAAGTAGRLYYASDNLTLYRDNGSTLDTLTTASTDAPVDATYVTRTANATLTNEVLLADVYAHELKTRWELISNGDALFPEILFMDSDPLYMEIPQ